MCNFDKDLLKSSLRLRKLFLLFFFLFNKKKQEIDRYSWKLKYYTIIRCVLSKWDYFVKKENLILGLKIKTRTNKEEQKLI